MRRFTSLFSLLTLLALPCALVAQTRPAKAAPAAAPAAAQPAAQSATLSGMVFDSLSMRPLAGASIIASGSNTTATSDAQGHYAMNIDSLAEGPHTIGFFHPILDSLGISPPPHTIVIRHGVSVVLDLAMPSAATLVSSVCPDSLRMGGRGLIIGEVRDADADRPLDSAIVVVQWTDVQVGTNSIARLPRAINARSDKQGIFRMCGVPPNTPLRAQARRKPKASGWIELSIPPAGAIVQQFLVGDRSPGVAAAAPAGAAAAGGGTAPGGAAATAVAHPLGSAMITGSVLGPDGQPLEGAQVILLGTSLSARSDARGVFRMRDLPSGTQEVEVRLLSYQPKQYTVNLAAKKEAHLNAVLDQRAQVLEPVVVTGRTTSDIPGFDQRKKEGAGTFFDHQQIMAATVNQITDVLRQVPGMQVLYVNGAYTVVTNRGSESLQCQSANVWIDGVKFDLIELNIDDVVRPTEIAAMEVYPAAIETPAQFSTGAVQCGTVVIWTEMGHFKKKAQPADTTH